MVMLHPQDLQESTSEHPSVLNTPLGCRSPGSYKPHEEALSWQWSLDSSFYDEQRNLLRQKHLDDINLIGSPFTNVSSGYSSDCQVVANEQRLKESKRKQTQLKEEDFFDIRPSYGPSARSEASPNTLFENIKVPGFNSTTDQVRLNQLLDKVSQAYTSPNMYSQSYDTQPVFPSPVPVFGDEKNAPQRTFNSTYNGYSSGILPPISSIQHKHSHYKMNNIHQDTITKTEVLSPTIERYNPYPFPPQKQCGHSTPSDRSLLDSRISPHLQPPSAHQQLHSRWIQPTYPNNFQFQPFNTNLGLMRPKIG